MKPPMNGTELAQALGITRQSYDMHRKRGDYKRFEIVRLRPSDPPRYSRTLVEQWLNGQPIAVIGTGQKTYRRSA